MRKGQIGRTEDGREVLINERGEAFNVSLGIISIWEMLDGTRTISEIADDISQVNNSDPKALEEDLTILLTKMQDAGLVE